MSMQLVDNDTFLKELGPLFESCKDHGSIWLTHKRLTHEGPDVSMNDEYPVLLRATTGSTTKLSTHVLPSSLPTFHTAYNALLRAHLSVSLRPRDKKREKSRLEQIKKKIEDREGGGGVVIEGPKRGNGRRKRQRRVRAALKAVAEKEKVKESAQ